MTEGNIITGLLQGIGMVGEWLIEFIPTVLGMFWSAGTFTALGWLLVIGMGISIFFLIVGFISNFIRLRG